ncbi:hypothetical protein HK098_007575 [Nowakowskiella sp. JEL0407]|nr:hypothetical protein HK098_007575 [Nowakowskiella sp. JEL0407]
MNCAVPRILQGQSGKLFDNKELIVKLNNSKDTPINEFGVRQASAVAWRLRKEKFDYIYSSDLLRARETAGTIREFQPSAEYLVDSRLREQDLGDLTGMPWTNAKRILKAEDVVFQDHVASHGGEAVEVFQERVIEFYTNLIDSHLIRPHRELMNSIAAANAAIATSLISTPLERANNGGNQMGRLSITDSGIPGQIYEPPSPTRNNLSGPPLQTPQQQLTTQSSSGQMGVATTLLKPTSQVDHPHQAKPQHPTRRPKMQPTNVLLVTHGGWIQELFDHLLRELGFQLECEPSTGFPKNTGVFQFEIVKCWKEDGDYEWEGRVSLMNCVSHFSGLSKRFVNGGIKKDSEELERDRNELLSRSSVPKSPQALRKNVAANGGSGTSEYGLTSAIQMAFGGKTGGISTGRDPVSTNSEKVKPKIKSLGW